MASDELKATIELMRSQKGPADQEVSLEQMRAGMEQMQGQTELPGDVEVEPLTVSGVAAEWIRTPDSSDRVLIYFHGGGYVMGSLNTHRELCSRISRSCKAKVLNVDYRLAPENPYPAAVDDGVASYRWLLEQDTDPAKILMGGDSAGGGLTLATLIKLKREGIPLPAAGLLLSPWTDLAVTGESLLSRAELDPMVDREGITRLAEVYCGDQDSKDPLISPLYGDLTGLPPLLIQVGGAEVLHDDATRLAEKAEKEGVSVDLQEWEDAFHVFQAVSILPEAAEALVKMGAFADSVTGPA
jgi:monoterpene epsilon-lactone hydrolase